MADKKRSSAVPEPKKAALHLHAASSEDEVHKASNVVLDVLYRRWQTNGPSDSAWISIDLDPPSAIQRLVINNAGTALLEVYGLREGRDEATDDVSNDVTNDVSKDVSGGGIYQMLLPAQQLMSAGDVQDRKNTNREFVYEAGTRLLKLATEHKWRRLKLVCKQPFGAQDEPIGLARVRVFPCDTLDEEAAKSRHEARLARVQAAVADFDTYQKKPLAPIHKLPLAKLSDEQESETPKEPPKPTGKRLLPSWMSASPGKPGKGSESGNGRGKKRKAEDEGKREEKKSRGGAKNGAEKGGVNEYETEQQESQSKRRHLQRGERSSEVEKDIHVNEASDSLQEANKKRKKKGPSKKHSKESETPASDAETEKSDCDIEDGLETEVASSSKQVPFEELLQGVVFAISGIQNPERGQLRKQAEDMGAEYRSDWGKECTLLACAYKGTPKFNQVKKANGTIVDRKWILECHSQGRLVDINGHLLFAGKPWRNQTVDAVQGGNTLQKEIGQLEDEQVDGPAVASSSQEQKLKRGRKRDARESISSEQPETGGGLQRKTSRKELNADVASWVDADVAAAERFLEGEGAEPGPGETMRDLGVQGVLGCFDFMVEELEAESNLEEAREGWVTSPPKGVQEIVDTCLGEGREVQIVRLKEMKERYQKALSKEKRLGDKELRGGEETDRWHEQAGDDSATTIVLTAEEIAVAKGALSRKYATRNT